jgi:predicted dinucleotide-binding enzyme
MRLVDRLGFDPVNAGPLKNGLALEPDGSPIAATYSAEGLAKLVSPPRPNHERVRAGSTRAGDES